MLGRKTFHDNTQGFVALSHQQRTADSAEDKAIDIRGSEAVMFSHAVGTWTDGVHTLTYYHRSNGGAWVRIPYVKMAAIRDGVLTNDNGNAVTVINSADFDGQVLDISYIGDAHDVKVEAVVTGTTVGASYSSTARLGNLRHVGMTPLTPGWPGDLQG